MPGCVHADLLRAGKIPDPFHGANELDLQWIEERDREYRAEFAVPPSPLAEDTVATVFVNGEKIAATDNMFIAHRWHVRRRPRAGKNELRIRFRSALDHIRDTRADFTPPREFNDPVGNRVRIRKQRCQFGWDLGPRPRAASGGPPAKGSKRSTRSSSPRATRRAVSSEPLRSVSACAPSCSPT